MFDQKPGVRFDWRHLRGCVLEPLLTNFVVKDWQSCGRPKSVKLFMFPVSLLLDLVCISTRFCRSPFLAFFIMRESSVAAASRGVEMSTRRDQDGLPYMQLFYLGKKDRTNCPWAVDGIHDGHDFVTCQ